MASPLATAEPLLEPHGSAHGEHHHGASNVAHHFDTAEQQFDSAKLGMWVFLVTEILMFGGLFAAFILFKSFDEQVFVEAHHHLSKPMGGLNTAVLLTSSWTMALGVRSAQLGRRKQTGLYLLATIACAFIFLVVKYFEYKAKFEHGLLPGPNFTNHELPATAQVFFSLYFMMTGLHGIHVTIGIGLIAWVWWLNNKGRFSPEYYTPIDLVGLYWHLVDLIWIYLFPLLYLIGLAPTEHTRTAMATHTTHTTSDMNAQAAAHATADDLHLPHADPFWLYALIFGTLLVLTGVTFGASYVDFGKANTVIAVIIASSKALLVAVFFMHLRHDKRFNALVFVSGLFFLSFLFIFTLGDTSTRNEVDPDHDRLVQTPSAAVTASAAASGAPSPTGASTGASGAVHH